MRIPPHFFTKPEDVTVEEVLRHPNSEVKYVGMKIVGLDKIMSMPTTRIVHRDVDQFNRERVLFEIPKILKNQLFMLKLLTQQRSQMAVLKTTFCVYRQT